ncbi:hypothetical protein GLOIN_2v909324 [Rhizophagus irregularis DAOM 181602=DAOM 197198]|uniref:Uncharacterized protein n=2 Tax=Rhizophagus irregularis TaxID=588596 RepID=U9T6P5_RHIID|nr:hypothetical protein GLOIN_2v909324 [Rhizophagus irregularis DAOM 181602=DAOM 197198]EXX72583.1 hypothetical protein RirG_067960 [Rhizophagus irregularis DAOM 197198w]POG58510.1 hypothetical protein GLOIN_2v909324 [Rhizophagus irregularis DAOM 181602=DAOM 197198]GBC41416.1 hypothetical protein GLOIN_2v909324 [Rhizophagus irregularis DAOM 181602=DAOM 197198]|eukprot:XP_025165376.1 hypothetical protein GLOIN_2v909324 [Rhizophagus irregularis DAOM 181602=DAOM 197198]
MNGFIIFSSPLFLIFLPFIIVAISFSIYTKHFPVLRFLLLSYTHPLQSTKNGELVFHSHLQIFMYNYHFIIIFTFRSFCFNTKYIILPFFPHHHLFIAFFPRTWW